MVFHYAKQEYTLKILLIRLSSLGDIILTTPLIRELRRKYPDAKIDFRDCFYKVEREGSLDWSMDDVGERLGRPYDTDLFLVNMSSYYGRIVVSDGRVQISSEMVPNRFRD